MIKYKNINWKLYQKVLIPDVSPHIEVVLTEQEANELLEKTDAYFIRWTNEWDRKDGKFWYVIKDEKEDINNYRSKIRNQIKKGLKNCKVEKVTKEYIAKYGYEVYKKAFKRYNTFLQPVSEENFSKGIFKSLDNIDFFGVFIGNKLVAYSQNKIRNNICEYNTTKFDPDFLKYRLSEALFFEMNKYYLNEKKFLYVSDGARSLSHETNIQKFLISKFKFRKAYCKLNVVYRKDIEILVNVLYPFRNFIYKSNNKILQKIGVVLRHEEIRRSYE